MQPLKRPRREFRVTFAHAHEIATHVRPAECQQQLSLFDLLHRLVTAVAINHQHALRVVGKVRLRDVVTAARIEYINNRVFAGEQPQPPTIPRLSGFFYENSPSRLVRLKVR